MSTRSIIAEVHGDGFRGRYCHSDGYPTWQLKHLHRIVTETFNGDVEAALKVLLGEQSWSNLDADTTIEGPDWVHRPGMEDMLSKYKFVPGVGSAHNDHNEPDDETWWLDYHGEKYIATDTEWAYAIDARRGRVTVFTIDRLRDERELPPFASVPKYVGSYDLLTLDTSEEALYVIECGENYERCGHYASTHFPEAENVRVGTQEWLGRKPMDFHDIIGVKCKGRKYTTTGSGHRGLGSRDGYRGEFWTSYVKNTKGVESTLVTAVFDDDGNYIPAPGVEWIFPKIPART